MKKLALFALLLPLSSQLFSGITIIRRMPPVQTITKRVVVTRIKPQPVIVKRVIHTVPVRPVIKKTVTRKVFVPVTPIRQVTVTHVTHRRNIGAAIAGGLLGGALGAIFGAAATR